MPCCDHTRFQSPPKAPEAPRIRLLISMSMVLSDAIVLPKYVKLLTDFSGVPYISMCGMVEVCPGGGWWSVTVFFLLIVSPNKVAACSKCLQISLMSSSVCATIAASSVNSSSRMQSSRVFVFALSLAKLNNCPSVLVRMKTPILKCSDAADCTAPRKRVNKVGAKTHHCFNP